MMRSLFSGVSGLSNHQVKMDVIGNNIANVNTMGFKSSRATFSEVFSQTLRGAGAPSDERGGTNAQQIGLGTGLSGTDTLHTQGSLQTTGNPTDLGIEGDGFFLLNQEDRLVYSRAGGFSTDADGYLVNAAGLRVQGWRGEGGQLPETNTTNLDDLRIPMGETVGAQATSRIVYANNLSADADPDETWSTPVEVFDSQGREYTVNLSFSKADSNTWNWELTTEDEALAITGDGSGAITFSDEGNVTDGETPDAVGVDVDGASALALNLDFEAITQMSGSSTVSAVERDGSPMGTLESFDVDASGVITGVYSNGTVQTLGQVGIASFSNPSGMTKAGDNIFMESNNSGLRQVGPPGTSGRGLMAPGSLEMSNVDLSEQFSEMIITQRGFQANSRVVTTSDDMLSELVNLKR